jgi:hydroxyacylglutathione hydrolase
MQDLIPISALSDNYIWFINNQENTYCVIVDPGDATPVVSYLNTTDLQPEAILITHHHDDHTAGISEIIHKYPVPVYGAQSSPIPLVNNHLREGNLVKLPKTGLELTVIETPGHTQDHIVYYGNNMLFCGDVLFAAGCGQVFEGTMKEMYNSLNKLKKLPDSTLVCCAHEYTLANLQFAQIVDPNNVTIKQRILTCQQLQQQNLPTLPSTIDLEKNSNPFLRCEATTIIEAAQRHSGSQPKNAVETFSIIRKWKNTISTR